MIVLSLLVFVHEGGHFLCARAFGMRVTEFYLGLPSRWRLCKKLEKIGTEIGVTPLLLGGYTRICGMEGVDDELLAPCLAFVQEKGRISAADVAERFSVDEGRALKLLVTLADWASIEPYYDPELGERPGQATYPERFQTQRRDANLLTAYDAGHDFTLEGSTLAGESCPLAMDADSFLEQERSRTYLGKGFFARVITLAGGPFVNVLLAFVAVTLSLSLVGVTYSVNSNQIGKVVAGGYADQAGLRAGDTVLMVGDIKTDDWNGVSSALDEVLSLGEDFTLLVERDGEQLLLTVDIPEGTFVDKIGIVAPTKTYHLSLSEAMGEAFSYGQKVATVASRLIMPQHTVETLEGTSSIVGITAMAGEAASSGFSDLMLFAAMISMSLGFMNLLPVPPLDGGKILLEVVQVVIRRPLSNKAMTVVSYVGLAFFLFIFTFALKNDIMRLFIG